MLQLMHSLQPLLDIAVFDDAHKTHYFFESLVPRVEFWIIMIPGDGRAHVGTFHREAR